MTHVTPSPPTKSFPTKSFDSRGFDSSKLLTIRVGNYQIHVYTINAKMFQGLGPKRRESSNGDRVYVMIAIYEHSI